VSNPVYEAILNRLGMVVMERLPHGVFLRLGTQPPPAWFTHAMLAANPNEAVTISEALPFVGHFMDEAEAFWREGRDGALRSEAFTVADPSGAQMGLAVTAVMVGHRSLLVLERIADFEERRRALQSARENALEHEAHLGQTRALLQDISDTRTLAQHLAESGLAAAPRQLALQIGEHLTRLSSAVEALAPMPDSVTRGHSRPR
jgi:hypothetical protein